MATQRLILGDCVEVMRGFPSESFDAVVSDPPSGIGFMGAKWDSDKGGRRQWVAWMTEVFTEVYRVLKPGAHGLVWSLPRTSHWTAWSLEDAGFDVRDKILHLFGSGFPKSLDVSKAIDKRGGANIGWFGPWLRAERERRGITQKELARHFPSKTGGLTGCVANWELGLNLPTVEQFNTLCDALALPFSHLEEAEREIVGASPHGFGPNSGASLTHTMKAHPDITAPATDAARQWEGWGTALKPSYEDWWLIRRPLAGTVAQNVLEHGTGALNIDGCRLSVDAADNIHAKNPHTVGTIGANGVYGAGRPTEYVVPAGRWPANVVLSHEPPDEHGNGGCREVGTKRVKSNERPNCAGKQYSETGNRVALGTYGDMEYRTHLADPDGLETVPSFICSPECAVRMLDEQAGARPSGGSAIRSARRSSTDYRMREQDRTVYTDSGSASRFYFCAKASPSERGEYNDHPTVKNLALMRWLVKLVTPPGGTILDPFCGSGSTLVAADRLGFSATGIDSDSHALDIARRRLHEDGGMFSEVMDG